MNVRLFTVCALGLALGAGCFAQDPTAPSTGTGPAAGQRGEHGMGPGGMAAMGHGIMGTVTEVAPDHFLVKNAANEIYTIHYSANTRVMKQPPPAPGAARQERPMGGGGNPPTPIKPTDIKVGDAIAAGGETDDAAKSVGAVFVLLLDPERTRQMKEMQANFGKTWLMGKVTAVNETKVTVHSGVDNADHTFAADENTTFRKHRDPITLADVQVGDNIRVEGAMKDGQFVAQSVSVMMPPAQGGPARRPGNEAPPQ
jgi:preprotein translocase subunit YajC